MATSPRAKLDSASRVVDHGQTEAESPSQARRSDERRPSVWNELRPMGQGTCPQPWQGRKESPFRLTGAFWQIWRQRT